MSELLRVIPLDAGGRPEQEGAGWNRSGLEVPSQRGLQPLRGALVNAVLEDDHEKGIIRAARFGSFGSGYQVLARDLTDDEAACSGLKIAGLRHPVSLKHVDDVDSRCRTVVGPVLPVEVGPRLLDCVLSIDGIAGPFAAPEDRCLARVGLDSLGSLLDCDAEGCHGEIVSTARPARVASEG
jgi:hypothetical protein